MSGNSVQRLQVIDPHVLKMLLEQLNTHAQRQTVINTLDDSGIIKIIHNYDKYMKEPVNSELKESFKNNLSRIKQYKCKKRDMNQYCTA